MKPLFCILLTTSFLACSAERALCARTLDPAAPPAAEPNAPKTPPVEPNVPEKPVTTEHTIVVNGKTIAYTATAGYLPVKDDHQKAVANMFYIAYVAQTSQPLSQRPVTFAFNGGPGSSAIWLHMGALGPKRALLPPDGTTMPARFELVDNEYTWLPFTDLVFIDPIGTGYSRPAGGADPAQFYSVQGDADSVGKMIRLYVTQNDRWLSPKYLAGESYGTTRAAALTGYLQNDCGMMLNGLFLISMVLNFETISYDQGSDLAYALIVPSYTAVARYHDKLSASLAKDFDKTLEEVRQWTLNDYLLALAKGSRLPDPEQKKLAEKLAAYSGLSESYVANSRMRIAPYRYTKELLRDQNYIIGLLDGRVKCPDTSALGEYAAVDPSLFDVKGPFVAVFNDYVRTQLNFRTEMPYQFMSDKVNQAWKWNQQQGYTYVADTLSRAMNLNDHLRLFVASGYYDLTTPWLAQAYTIEHLDIPVSFRDHVSQRLYESGHQIYTSLAALTKLSKDAEGFISGEEGSL